MDKEIIRAEVLLKKFDFYHLAKQFYKHLYRHPELEEEIEWQSFKQATEDYLVMQRFRRVTETEMSQEDYRKFLRFYTGLEVKGEEPKQELVFNEQEKNFFEKIIKLR